MYFLSQKKIHAGVTVFDHSLHPLVCNISLMLLNRYRDTINSYKYQGLLASVILVLQIKQICSLVTGGDSFSIPMQDCQEATLATHFRKLQLLQTQSGLLLSQENNIRGGIRGINAKKLKLFIPCGGCFRKKKIQTLSFSIHYLIQVTFRLICKGTLIDGNVHMHTFSLNRKTCVENGNLKLT